MHLGSWVAGGGLALALVACGGNGAKNAPDAGATPDAMETPAPADTPKAERDLSDLVITLERMPCYGRCPVYVVTFVGNNFVESKGTHTGSVDRTTLDALVAEFESVGYWELQDSYKARGIMDAPTVKTSITLDGKTKAVEHYWGDRTAPKNLIDFEARIDELAGSAKWIGTPTQADPK